MRKNVLITGASRGIGKSIAIKFASENYDIILNYYKSDSEAKILCNELITKYQVNVLLIKCDISNESDVVRMISQIKEKYDKLDVIINNAGISIDKTFEDKTSFDFQKVLSVNLVGMFLVIKYSKELLTDKSVIINVSSTNGIDTNYIESIDYDASKAGVISLTHNLASYLAPIRVNCICPGWVETDMSKDLASEFKEKEIQKIMLKRFADPKEISNVIYFLASDEASYINNSIIRIDGGING